eukprot:CAMPEP_0119408742 /NCGR_PEP_ID=MMETSP1335-20130426/2212_1 /TAXON_ID=259385 /ORGANISM="Chrysoculter rhomboideus, Strain RCC1486" /LENGTH=72 /DNA_ID=CAMNT_0007433021 /DNA_START=418 /DNA_END=633 /DNA_ORIENTATION=+
MVKSCSERWACACHLPDEKRERRVGTLDRGVLLDDELLCALAWCTLAQQQPELADAARQLRHASPDPFPSSS